MVPTLFTPLEDTRLANRQSAKLPELTDLQWEFFFTCWCYNLDFFVRERRQILKSLLYSVGIPIYYYSLGRKLFGQKIKYPLWRLAHLPEWMMRSRFYLELDRPATRFRLPERVSEAVFASATFQPGNLVFDQVRD